MRPCCRAPSRRWSSSPAGVRLSAGRGQQAGRGQTHPGEHQSLHSFLTASVSGRYHYLRGSIVVGICRRFARFLSPAVRGRATFGWVEWGWSWLKRGVETQAVIRWRKVNLGHRGFGRCPETPDTRSGEEVRMDNLMTPRAEEYIRQLWQDAPLLGVVCQPFRKDYDTHVLAGARHDRFMDAGGPRQPSCRPRPLATGSRSSTARI